MNQKTARRNSERRVAEQFQNFFMTVKQRRTGFTEVGSEEKRRSSSNLKERKDAHNRGEAPGKSPLVGGKKRSPQNVLEKLLAHSLIQAKGGAAGGND